jgi:RHH-type rel operon transcriptional repressor/antitoxin RelB
MRPAREAILESLEDLEDLDLAGQRLSELRAGAGRAVPLDDVTREQGLEA